MLRARSLFWTFAGVFLAVLVAATAVQIVVSVGVLRPLAVQSARESAVATIDHALPDLLALSDPADVPRVIPVLRAHPPDAAGDILVFCVANGPAVPDRRLPSEAHRAMVVTLARAGLTDSLLADRLPLEPGLAPGPVESEMSERNAPPERVRQERDFARPFEGPPAGGPPPGSARAAPPQFARAPRFELLAHRTVAHDGRVLGELAVLGPVDRGVPWGLPRSRALLLLPLAVLAAAAAGLIMVRLLVRRLRSLEAAADRVIAGDLRARIDAHGLDEIGRLEERFNRMTDRLAAARDRLEETDQQRRRLLADITHELATPLTSIRGYVETLLDPAVETTHDERLAYLRDVRDESLRLDEMIGELFELARLEAGATPLKRVRLDWTALCRNITRRLEPRFHEAGLELAWDGEPQAAWVKADGRRIEQVVENLLSNALRYVPSGGHVWVSLVRVASPAGMRQRLVVSDDGPGIAADDLPHVFERFYRAEAARSMGGTGLGLAIVAEIVRQHGGEVRAERREPRGAAFVVELEADEG